MTVASEPGGRPPRRADLEGAVSCATRMAAMRWPGRQRKVLDRVRQQLLAEDPRLAWMLASFARLTPDDAMPAAKRIETGPQRLLRVARNSRRRRRATGTDGTG